MDSDAADAFANRIEVSYDSRHLDHPRIVDVKVANTGNTPVRAADYERPIVFELDGGHWPIDATLIGESTPRITGNLFESKPDPPRAKSIRPPLLNAGDWFTLRMLFDNKDSRVIGSHRIVGGLPMRESTVELASSQARISRYGLELWAEQLLRSHPTRVDFILVDLDHFKAINDTHGHAAGNEVLIRPSNRLEATLGGDGLLARTGGEESTVLMTNRDSTEASDAIRAAVHDPRDKIPVTASVGVASLTFDDIFGSDPVDPLREGPRRADIALYEAKSAGRNRVQTYPGPPGADLSGTSTHT
jgi:diguanylate cyclase (GGDEF)-like protein